MEIRALNPHRVPGDQTSSGLRLRYFPEHSLLGTHCSRRLGEALALQVGNVDVVQPHNTFELLNVQVARFRRKTKTFFSPHGGLDLKLFGDWSARSILYEEPRLCAARAYAGKDAGFVQHLWPKKDMDYWHECEHLIVCRPMPERLMRASSQRGDRRNHCGHDLFFVPTRGENFGHVFPRPCR